MKIIIIAAIRKYITELPNKRLIKSIIKQHIKDPILIEMKVSKAERFENPPIKLPDHTPVRGKGSATKRQSKNIDLSFDLLSSLVEFFEYFVFIKLVNLSFKKPVDFLFNILHKRIIGKDGIMLPKNVQARQTKGVNDGFVKPSVIAKGSATLPSRVGVIATRMTASHRQLEKFDEKNSNIIYLIHLKRCIC